MWDVGAVEKVAGDAVEAYMAEPSRTRWQRRIPGGGRGTRPHSDRTGHSDCIFEIAPEPLEGNWKRRDSLVRWRYCAECAGS